jgi:hypothetical protein
MTIGADQRVFIGGKYEELSSFMESNPCLTLLLLPLLGRMFRDITIDES